MMRLPASLFLLVLLLALTGCGGGNGEPGDQAADPAGGDAGDSTETKGTIGFSALTLTNPFFKVIADNMKEEAAKHGYEVLVVSGERDVKKQADQVSEFIVKGVSAIVLNPCDSQAIGPAIKKANDAGIPVFTNDIKYDGEVGEVVCHVATDNYQGGKLAGKAMVDLIGDSGGNVAILHFPQAESCQLRVKGFREVIDAHNAGDGAAQIEIVAVLDGGGVRDEGFKAAKDTIEANPDLAAIFAINDPSALGARAALEAAGKADQVKIIGFDGQKIGKQAILEGKIVCDPIQFPDRIGKATIEQIVRYFDGDEVPEEILIPSELYYQEDAKNDPELQE
ncbi:D-ribose-binding periplasmic protein precursor [Maioricimonas rarisocia]|uniref:D-ribose-binding periplasmic protein n=1 Tax=Maioricimonas rarisocia TaxID=2528026 RepID=A0A517ZFH1_9PLAN|nr:substrate-binding domain-containing protein [Maioricimonas rarisocia]QDU41204.1 D-ribose-binding periplasmic protein precursor [Maioricimonas rarisocia]